MPDIPDSIRKAAHDATNLPLAEYMATSPYELIDKALDAAAPLLADAVAAKILDHMNQHGPAGKRRIAWRLHFGIAAQVATRAFTTEAEEKRQAAEALASGNYIGCDPEAALERAVAEMSLPPFTAEPGSNGEEGKAIDPGPLDGISMEDARRGLPALREAMLRGTRSCTQAEREADGDE